MTGLVGAAGGLGGFVPPLIMGYVYGRTDSYAIGLWMLVRHRCARPAADRHRRPPYRRPGTGSSLTPPQKSTSDIGMDGALADALVRSRRFFTKADRLRRPADAAPRSAAAQADDFYRDRWSHDKVVRSTHGVNCTGSCSWKVYVKDGIITWETQQTDYPSVGPGLARSTSRAAARAARRSPGTPTRRPGCATRTCAASCCRCTARPRRSTTATRCWPGRDIVDDPERATALQVRARQGRPGPRHAGTRPPRSSPPPTCTRSRSTGPTGSPASRRSRRCRWSRTPSGARFVNLIGGSMLSLLRLVRRPAGRLAAGVRRPDRRARVRRLVERRLPDHVGLQPAGHPHPRRALDDRGALPRPEGHRGRARTTPTT